MRTTEVLREYIELIVETSRVAQLSGNRTAEWGCDDHVDDLELRVADATYWRDKHPRGSEKRSHYKNVVTHLKRELQSARMSQQRRLNEKQK